MSGQLIGNRYRVLRKIGEGGMAVVHLAVDEKLGRDVAIKILRERYENHDEIRIRFQHEARAISSFDHPNILKIYDFSGEESRQLWIVTELIHGRNLAQILETTPSGWLHPAIASSIVREICRALASAHEHGVVHRDVKPENVMITHHGTVKLMDFGIAKIQRITNMTQTGIFMGSPSYMSPEQVRGRDVDNRSDIYSLGVLFYELITGRLPFTGSSTADIAMRILNGDFAHPRFMMAGIPDALDQCIVQCMALNSENRPQSVEVVGEKIDALLQSMGLDSSIQELERCFKDPKAYGDRLARILKVSQVKQEATLLLENNQGNFVGRWNNEAINSPIPRPDIAASSSSNSQRKDHLLPPRSVPHFTKRHLTPELIAAHLPERRHQQRPTEATRLASGSKYGQYPAKAQTPKNMGQNREPRRVFHGQNSAKSNLATNQQIQNNQQVRGFRPVSRIVPATPKRQQRPQRHIIKETYYPESSAGSFGKFVLAILLLSCAGILWFGDQKEIESLTNWITFTDTPKKSALNNTKTSLGKSQSQSQVKAQVKAQPKTQAKSQAGAKIDAKAAAGSSKASTVNNIPKNSQPTPQPQPLPKFAEKVSTKTNTSKNIAFSDLDHKGNEPSTDRNQGLQVIPDKISKTPITPKRVTDTNKIPTPSSRPSISISKPTATNPAADSVTVNKNVVKIGSNAKENNADEALEMATPIPKNAAKSPSRAAENEKQKEPRKVQISVSSTPAAELFVNGRRAGTTNNNGSTSDWIDVDPGKNKIELRRSGFITRIENIFVSGGEREKFGPYTLTRGSSPVTPVSFYRLTLVTNLPPVDVTVINIETGARQSIALTQASKTIQLERGNYEVTMSRKGESRKRRLDFSGAVQQLTFSVDFKESSN